ncbi:hypothetical protein Drorol1_Dr00006385 [Drosera rotundifolia]
MRGGCPVSGHKLRRCWKTQPPAATDTSASPWSVVFVSRGLRDKLFWFGFELGFCSGVAARGVGSRRGDWHGEVWGSIFQIWKAAIRGFVRGSLAALCAAGVGCSSAAKSRNWWWLV